MGLFDSTVSKTIMSSLNKSINDIILGNTSSCKQDNIVSGVQDFSGSSADKGCKLVFKNISQDISNNSNLSCITSQTIENDLKAKLASAVKQNTEASLSGLNLGIGSNVRAEAETHIASIVENKSEIKNLSECISKNIQTGLQNFSNNRYTCPAFCSDPSMCSLEMYKAGICNMKECEVGANNISQNIVNRATANCTFGQGTIQKQVSEIATTVEQTASAKTEGIDLGALLLPIVIVLGILGAIALTVTQTGSGIITSAFGANAKMYMYIGIAIAIVLLGVYIYYNFFNKKEDKQEEKKK